MYGLALRLYPRSFRDEYGPDLLLLVADQLHDESGWRVQARSAVDLVLTIPTSHLEAHMNRRDSHLIPALFGGVALGSVAVGITVGQPMVLLACLAVAVASGWLGLLAAHRTRPLAEAGPRSGDWWKLLASGGGLLVALIAATTVTGELSQGIWFVAMLGGLVALLLLGAGIVLGVTHLASRRSRHAV